MKKTTNKKLKAIDFFCGAGGMSYGLKLANIKVIAGIDNNPECRETYEKNIKAKFLLNDIQKFSQTELKKQTGIKRNDDNLIFVGCSPCQYWSQINTDRSKSDKTKNLLADFQRFVDAFKPGYVLIENVPGILKRSNESGIDGFIEFLEINKYKVAMDIIDTSHYGVPQKRKRFVLIASRVNKEINIPKLTQKEIPKVSDFIGINNGFSKIKAGETDKNDHLHKAANLSKTNIERLKKTKKNGGDRLAWKDDPALQINAYKGKDHHFKDTYGRMSWDRPAPTITTKFLHISNGRFGHPEENRGLSLREGACLQTFPKDFEFIGNSMTSIACQIGNAVPPEFAKRIGENIKEN
ncbi:MAG: DNA cytosine methyltransferase [bacterium]